jgi:hypothetical protein
MTWAISIAGALAIIGIAALIILRPALCRLIDRTRKVGRTGVEFGQGQEPGEIPAALSFDDLMRGAVKAAQISPFSEFSARFVRLYWQTVKERRFPMLPDEPVEETIEQLLSSVSVDIDDQRKTIMMKSKHGDWWQFIFRACAGEWRISSCHARSLDPKRPHDLLSPPYDSDFRPFLDYVAQVANRPEK